MQVEERDREAPFNSSKGNLHFDFDPWATFGFLEPDTDSEDCGARAALSSSGANTGLTCCCGSTGIQGVRWLWSEAQHGEEHH